MQHTQLVISLQCRLSLCEFIYRNFFSLYSVPPVFVYSFKASKPTTQYVVFFEEEFYQKAMLDKHKKFVFF